MSEAVSAHLYSKLRQSRQCVCAFAERGTSMAATEPVDLLGEVISKEVFLLFSFQLLPNSTLLAFSAHRPIDYYFHSPRPSALFKQTTQFYSILSSFSTLLLSPDFIFGRSSRWMINFRPPVLSPFQIFCFCCAACATQKG